ncbi:histidine phosphatase family protein [Streptomyces sp. NPDC086787]|uniref:histidine phosphatase family protein n=1 Tax=Streptomyces sp. NPDC086787 TaxID=3365759 RepID=UPI00381F6BF4
MTIHLTFVCAPGGDATLDPFLGDAPLTERGLRAARATAIPLPAHGLVVRAPSVRCAQTADALGLTAVPEPALCDLVIGGWAGRTIGRIAATDPHGLSAWLTDPDATPHEGESVRGLCRRTGDWLTSLAGGTGDVVAITEAAVVRAALVHALATSARSFWHLTVPPLSAVSFSWRNGWWDVRREDVTAQRDPRWLLPRAATVPPQEMLPVS